MKLSDATTNQRQSGGRGRCRRGWTTNRASLCDFVRTVVLLLPLSLLLVLLTVKSCLAKKLVLFAGPHKAASQSVITFFNNHASGYEGTEIAQGLEGWLWPKVTEDLWDGDNGTPMDKSNILNALVSQADNTTAQIVLTRAIQEAWSAAEHGIVLGTPEFDRVGNTPFTHRNALVAMRGILKSLRITDPQEVVTVVLNYRTPRRDQWISMWKHQSGGQDDNGLHYKNFLCHGNHDEFIEVLDTAMNPLKLAQVYRKEKWKVVLMDESGVKALERDISHAIACDVLEHTNCENGFVIPVIQTYNDNYGGDKGLHSLDDKEQRDLDQLLRERDCYYEPFLRDDKGFRILYRDTIWQGCLRPEETLEEEKSQQELYEHLTDPETLLNAMKTQKSCGSTDSTAMKNVLVGNDYDSMVVSTISNSGPITDDDVADDQDGDFSTEESLGGPEESMQLEPKAKEDHNSPWLTSFLVLLAGGFGVYQLHLLQRHHSRRGGLHSSAYEQVLEQEMNDLSKPSRMIVEQPPPDLSLDLDLPESVDRIYGDFSHIDSVLSPNSRPANINGNYRDIIYNTMSPICGYTRGVEFLTWNTVRYLCTVDHFGFRVTEDHFLSTT